MEVTRHPPGSVAWVDLATSDPEGARAFYGSLLGWEFDVAPEERGSYVRCRLRGRDVAGMVGTPVTSMPPTWTTYFASDDLSATAQLVSAAGGVVVLGPEELPLGGLLLARDPAGTLFGFWRAGELLGLSLVAEPGTLVWDELLTPDVSGAREFYSRACGLSVRERGDGETPWRAVPGLVDAATGVVEGRAVVGMREAVRDGGAPRMPLWLPYFGVADIDGACSLVERLGGAVCRPPADSSRGRCAELRDAQGAKFGLLNAGAPSPWMSG